MVNGSSDLRTFGKFRLDTEKRVLWFEDEPVNLPLKEIELLEVLTEHPGQVVTRDEMIDRIWADSYVDENNLSRHIYLLRKVLKEHGESEDLIQTVPRRGYRFTGEVEKIEIDNRTEKDQAVEPPTQSKQKAAEPSRNLSSRFWRWIFVPVLLGTVVLAAAFYRFSYPSSAPSSDSTPQPINSIAVLPLKSLGGEEDNVLGLGLTDTLIANLSKFKEIRVLSTAATKDYLSDKREPSSIGKELDVGSIMDGSVQRADGKLRVTLRLIRTSDSQQIWTETFDGSEKDIFVLQDDIATQTAKALALNLDINNRDLVLKRYTQNTEAYQAYQSGRYLLYQSQYDKAIKEFERALQFDAKYVLAYAGLSDAYAFLANNAESTKRAELYEKAKLHALQALALDDSLAEAHVSLGWIRRIYDWDWAESEKHLRRAVELDPNSGLANQRLGFLYITLGKTADAVPLSLQATKLNPVVHSAGWAYFCNRQYEESAAEYARRLSLATSPETQREPLLGLAIANIELGKNEEAIRLIEESPPDIKSDFANIAALTIALYRSGETGRAGENLQALIRKANEKPGRWVRLAYVYAVMDKRDDAFDALQKGIETRDDRLMWLKTTPYFDKLRDDPRFLSILRTMNLMG